MGSRVVSRLRQGSGKSMAWMGVHSVVPPVLYWRGANSTASPPRGPNYVGQVPAAPVNAHQSAGRGVLGRGWGEANPSQTGQRGTGTRLVMMLGCHQETQNAPPAAPGAGRRPGAG